MSPPPLPDELILRILSYTPPLSLIKIRHSSRQLKCCAEETILKILPKITLSTMQFALPHLKHTTYRFASINDPLKYPGDGLIRASASFKAKASEVLKFDPSVPWFIGWGVGYEGDFAVSELWTGVDNSADEELQIDFTIYDIMANMPEAGVGPWAEEGMHITAT